MATAQTIITDALMEIGALAPGETVSTDDLALGLTRLQNQIDAWGADRLTISISNRVTYTLTGGRSSVTIGLSGVADIAATRPTTFTAINRVITGNVETALAEYDEDQYAAIAIKAMTSTLPTGYHYEPTAPDGTLTFWPVPTGSVGLVLYYPAALGTPAALSSTLVGPPGYQEGFMYQLALRLCTPFGRQPPPLLPQQAAEAYARLKRPNTEPGLLAIDAALTPTAGGYNVFTDQFAGGS